MNDLKRLRKQKGLTQEELAAAIGCTQGNVSAWERGAVTPTPQRLMDLCEYFHVTQMDLSADASPVIVKKDSLDEHLIEKAKRDERAKSVLSSAQAYYREHGANTRVRLHMFCDRYLDRSLPVTIEWRFSNREAHGWYEDIYRQLLNERRHALLDARVIEITAKNNRFQVTCIEDRFAPTDIEEETV